MNKKLAQIVKKDMIQKKAKESWGSIRREVAEDIAKNYTTITGVDVNDLFTKVDFYIGGKIKPSIYNVVAEIFDKQIPKIYKWVKQRYKLGTDDYQDMVNDFDFIDLITQELEYMVDINKLRYDEESL